MDKKHDHALKFLHEHKVATLSTASKIGKPWGAAIYYVAGDDMSLYFLTHKGSRKYQDLEANPQVAMTIFDDYAQRTIQIRGMVSEVTSGEERDMVFSKIAHVHPPGRFAWVPPVSKLEQGDTVLLKCTPEFMQLSEFRTVNGEPSISVIIGS